MPTPLFSLSHSLTAIKCPKCRQAVEYGDVFIKNISEGSKLTIGSATQVVLDPCGCTATSGDPDFLAMLQIVETIADPDKNQKHSRFAI